MYMCYKELNDRITGYNSQSVYINGSIKHQSFQLMLQDQ